MRKNEVWKEIPGYEGHYEASSCGRIRSLVMQSGPNLVLRKTPRIKSVYASKGGYLKTDLSKGNKCRTEYIHRLVLMAFKGVPANSQEGAHLNGIRSDNRLENLEWTTRAVNHSHKNQHGTQLIGERNPQAKLTDALVREMRLKYCNGQSYRSLANEYGLSKSYTHNVVSGKSWAHVKG